MDRISAAPIDVVDAQSTAFARFTFFSDGNVDEQVEFEVVGAARIVGVKVDLADGTPLTTSTRNAGSSATLHLGYVAGECVITVGLRATVPVEPGQGSITALAGETKVTEQFMVAGAAQFLAARCRLRANASVVNPGEAFSLSMLVANDGSAIANDVEVHLILSSLVAVTLPDGAWREVGTDGTVSVAFPIDTIAVGGRVSLDVGLVAPPVAADGTALEFLATVVHREQRTDLAPVTVIMESKALARVSVDVADREYRIGDRFAAKVRVASHGSDSARNVRVVLDDAGPIAWDEGGLVLLQYPNLAPDSATVALVGGSVRAIVTSREIFTVPVTATIDNGEVIVDTASVTIVGEPRLIARLAVGAADPVRCAHTVRLVLRNRGDAATPGVVVKAIALDDVVGVPDTLRVDGAARLAVDGGLDIARESGLMIPSIGLSGTVVVEWDIRASRAGVFEYAVLIEEGGRRHEVRVNCDLVDGSRRSDLPRPQVAGNGTARSSDVRRDKVSADPVSAPASVVQAPPIVEKPSAGKKMSSAGGAQDSARPRGSRRRRGGDPAVQLQAAPDADGAAPSAEPSVVPDDRKAVDDVVFAVDDSTRARLMAWFGPDGPNEDTALGVLVLAIREFLPRSASNPVVNEAIVALRAANDEIVTPRMVSFKRFGTVGASGYDFGSTALREATIAFYRSIGVAEPDVADSVALDAALVHVSSGRGTPYADLIGDYVEALGVVLGVADAEAYASPAASVSIMADALFRRIVADAAEAAA